MEAPLLVIRQTDKNLAASINHMFLLEQQATHVAYIIAEAARSRSSKPIIEPSEAAEQAWYVCATQSRYGLQTSL
jgi:hypothetical protein